jgi:hypothetical protein
MKPNPEYCRYLLDDGSQCPNMKKAGADFCEHHIQWADMDVEIFRAVTEHYRQDIREFWSRSNFYLLVEAGLLSVYVSLGSQLSPLKQAMSLSLGIFGLVIAVVWLLVCRASVVWIRRWRSFTVDLDKIIDRHRVYSRAEGFASTNPLFSSSTITQILPVLFFLGWITLIVIRLVE